MRLRRRVWKFLFWSLFLTLSCLGGVIGFAYWYVTDSTTIANLVAVQGKRFLPTSKIQLGRARIRPFLGHISLDYLEVNQKVDQKPFPTLQLPRIWIGFDPRAMLNGIFDPLEIRIRGPILRVRQRKDGTWNLTGLLADPWPGPMMKTPPIHITSGRIEMVSDDQSVELLRDLTLEIKPSVKNEQILEFEGTAKGEMFNRFTVRGSVNLDTGLFRLDNGDFNRLNVSETLSSRIPEVYRHAVEQVGLKSGEADIQTQLTFDETASPQIKYKVDTQIRSGVLNCPHLPFPINDLSAALSVENGLLRIERAQGVNGSTIVRLKESTVELGDSEEPPLNVQLSVTDLELDKRLQTWTPDHLKPLWVDYAPRGRIDAAATVVRAQPGGPVGFGWAVECRDVSMLCRFFKYPLDHITGKMVCENNQIRINAQTLIGGKPVTAKGTIDNPGDYAHVELDFQGDSLPIDKTLFDALPGDVRKYVDQFHPTGTVAGRAHLTRTRDRPEEPKEGKIAVHAWLRLNEHCAIKWDGLPYPVSNMQGKLELHPDEWIFTDVSGRNGQAVISGSGRVKKLPGEGERLKIDLDLQAENLFFDQQLHDALPPAWRKSWDTLNPYGSSRVEAKIHLNPGEPDQYRLVIEPKPETTVNLTFGPPTRPGEKEAADLFTLRMENVTGRFVSVNGTVNMEDVGFSFYGSPVQFERGQVQVEDSGQFQLGVEKVWVKNLRLDQEELLNIMPPVMKEFARRLDPGRPLSTLKGNLGLSWSGQLGDPVHCEWENVLVVLNDNTIRAGIPLEHLQGKLDRVRGRFDGQNLATDGYLKLESASLLGQQFTGLEAPFQLGQGKASLKPLRGRLLNGQLAGEAVVSLDATPRYFARFDVQNADLANYAASLSGHQTYKGLVSGQIGLSGMGNDLKTIQGAGSLQVREGNLGELPMVLRLINEFQRFKGTKTRALFDEADVNFTLRNGESILDLVKLTGNVISFQGRGKMDLQGHLDLTLNPLAGRDRFHVPFLSDAMREASGEILVVKARGPIAYPNVVIKPLPRVADGVNFLGKNRSARTNKETK